ncbi:MAG: pyruvate formate-lyase-activating protein [Methylocystaceae bacterium]
MQNEGYVHSIQTLGTLDGPGLRYVIFMQGCALRCAFCHNPDTWRMVYGRLVTVDWLVNDIKQYFPYIKRTGGVTVSGGEPLLQADFLGVLFRRLGFWNIHRVIDTSGFVRLEQVKEILDETDLVLMSIKHALPAQHILLTGQPPDRPQEFAAYLTSINKPVWLRYVLIPDYTNGREDLEALAGLIRPMTNVQRLELLPYNDMGKSKWQELGLSSSLPDLRPPEEDEINRSRELLTQLLPGLTIY